MQKRSAKLLFALLFILFRTILRFLKDTKRHSELTEQYLVETEHQLELPKQCSETSERHSGASERHLEASERYSGTSEYRSESRKTTFIVKLTYSWLFFSKIRR